MVEEDTGLRSSKTPLRVVRTLKAEGQQSELSRAPFYGGTSSPRVGEGSSAWDEERLDLGIWALPLTSGT